MEMTKKMLSQDKLKSLLQYDKDTGYFYWKQNRQKVKIGNVAGHNAKNGYCYIMIDGKSYRSHRLVWLYVYGNFPKHQIDHINRNKLDNRLENLREASKEINARNKGLRKTNKSGVTGVYWSKTCGKWIAKISALEKSYTIGRYDNFYDAVKARAAKQEILWKT
jgi:hypothetical protein